jgi:hypothetical protein
MTKGQSPTHNNSPPNKIYFLLMFWLHTKTSDVFNKHILEQANFSCQSKIRREKIENRLCLSQTPVPAKPADAGTFKQNDR